MYTTPESADSTSFLRPPRSRQQRALRDGLLRRAFADSEAADPALAEHPPAGGLVRERPQRPVLGKFEQRVGGDDRAAPPPGPRPAAPRSRTRSARRSPASPACRVPASWPGPRSSRSASATSKPSAVRARTASRSRASGDGRGPVSSRQCAACGAPADPAAQLVELREPEALGALDEHHGRLGNVEADLDDRRRHQQRRLAACESAPSPAPRLDRHPAVHEPHRRRREDAPAAAAAVAHGGRRVLLAALLDQRADDVGPAAPRDLAPGAAPSAARARPRRRRGCSPGGAPAAARR